MQTFYLRMRYFTFQNLFKIQGPKWWDVSTVNNEGNLYYKKNVKNITKSFNFVCLGTGTTAWMTLSLKMIGLTKGSTTMFEFELMMRRVSITFRFHNNIRIQRIHLLVRAIFNLIFNWKKIKREWTIISQFSSQSYKTLNAVICLMVYWLSEIR